MCASCPDGSTHGREAQKRKVLIERASTRPAGEGDADAALEVPAAEP